MRVASAIVLGSVVALALQVSPVMAKNSDAQKSDDKQASAPCRSYVQNPDGSWTELSCQRMDSDAQTQHKTPARGTEDDSR
jgi:hypothetical protein